jgi:hypothetical protein
VVATRRTILKAVCGGAVAPLLPVLLAGCSSTSAKAAEPDKLIFFLFDISGSTDTPVIRQRYYDCVSKVVDSLQGGEVIMGDIITENSMATASYPINTTFPARTPDTTDLMQTEANNKAKEQVLGQAKKLLLAPDSQPKSSGPSASASDIMNSLQLADKVFNGGTVPRATSKRLVMFSDMIEQTSRYDFSQPLPDDRVEEIIKAERSARRLPNLKGVRVWVAGATAKPKDGVSPDSIFAIQHFWLQYFKAAGADLSKDRFAATLLNWTPPATP